MKTLRRTLLGTAAVAAASQGMAFAQTDTDTTEVTDEIIVTGVARPTSKLESTASVSSLPPEEIERAAPRSTAEAFRSLPGIQVEPSSGDANTNLKVRGAPISAGGSRYVAFQEDGFNTLLVGDVAFATADSFFRFDRTVSSVQAIRGGSASTAAINSPGGIINLISRTGQEEEGVIAFTTGINYDSFRGDFAYGKQFDDTWSGHVGGYYRTGEGVREAPNGTEEGGQIKATLFGDFDRGSIALHFKHLDERVPTYLPIPAQFNGEGFDPIGIDFGDGTLFLGQSDFANRVDGVEENNGDGFEAKMTSFAVVADYEVSDILTAAFRHRTAEISGNFAAPFPAGVFNDGTEGAVEIVNFNTELRDFGNNFTQGSLTADFDIFTVQGGVEFASQSIDANWNFNQFYRTLDGQRITNRSFDLDGDGIDDASSVDGVFFGNPAFGNCCTRDYDFDVDLVSPFVSVTADFGQLTFDASYRDFSYEVDGTFAEVAVQAPQDINGDGMIGPNEVAVNSIGASRPADYDVDYDAWSIGANYQVTPDLAVFANIADGGSLSAPDRVTGSINEDGSIENQAAFSTMEQFEVGVKYTNGPASFFATYFNADTVEARQFEVSTQTNLEESFEAQGIELEGTYDFGNGFGIRGTATFTDSEIADSSDPSIIGNQPRRQADYIFNIAPFYETDRWTVGANVFGSDETFVQNNNDLSFEAYTITSVFGFIDITDSLRLQADVNNLFDTEAFTEGEEGSANPGDFVRIRPLNGRTASATLSYRF